MTQTDLQQIRTLVAVIQSLHVTLVHRAVAKRKHKKRNKSVKNSLVNIRGKPHNA